MMLAFLKKHHFSILTLTPGLALLSAFVYFPTAFSFLLSLFKTKLFNMEEFVGTRNYASVLGNRLFWIALRNTTVFTVGSVAGTLAGGLILALVLEKQVRGKAFFRAAFFMPYVIPYAGYVLIWLWILDVRYGLVNYLLGSIGVHPVPWLTSASWVLPAFILMSIWKRMGFAMVLFLAGLTTIPEEFYDAATVDGATWWTKLRHITLPLLRPVTVFVAIISIIYSFQLFIEPFVMTKGGPANASISIVQQLYITGLRTLNVGEASAMGVILFLLIFVPSILLFRRFRIEELY